MNILIAAVYITEALTAMAVVLVLVLVSMYYRRVTGQSLFLNPDREGSSIVSSLLQARRMDAQKDAHRAHLKALQRPVGIVFGLDRSGRYVCSPEAEDGHILAIGGTRSGKTAALLIPTLRSWAGRCFVLDISGDIISNARRENIAVIDADKGTGCYNIYAAIDAAIEDERETMIQRLAFSILPDSPGASDTGVYFTQNGRKILASALMMYYDKGLDFCEACENIVMLSAPELLALIWIDGSDTAKSLISDFRGANEKNVAGCKAAAGDAVSLFASSHSVRSILHRPGPAEPCVQPSTIEYQDIAICLKEESLELYAPLIAIITEQVMQYLTTRPPLSGTPVLLALDEFARIGKLGNIRSALATLAKRNVRIMILSQSLADLDLIYGRDARKVMCDNCQFKVILRATDPDTQEYFSKLIGKYNKTKHSHSWGSAGDTMTSAEYQDYIIPPEDFGSLGDNLILICPAGYEVLQKAFYFRAGTPISPNK